MERGFVRTSAGHIHYRASGRGEAILLLHINQQSSALYLELLEALETGFRAVAIDNPSHGHSDHVSTQPRLEDYARWTLEVMDGLKLQRASVLGEANGALVAIEMAAAFPGRIDRIVLVNCPFRAGPAVLSEQHLAVRNRALPADSTGFPAALTMAFTLESDPKHAPLQPTQSWMDRLNVAHMQAGRDRWQGFDALQQYDMMPRLPLVRCPALVLAGEHSPNVHLTDQLASSIEGCQARIIEGGRFCVTWERAVEVGRLTAEFMRQTGTRT